jgi:hypothetical protein
MQPVWKLLACTLYCYNIFNMEDGRFIVSVDCRKILSFQRYTPSDKNPSLWNFLSPEPEVTCGTVAIIIRVPTLGLLLSWVTLFTYSNSGARLSERSLTHLAFTTNAYLSILTLHVYEEQQQPSRLNADFSRILQLAGPKKCASRISFAVYQNVPNYRVVK